MYTYVTQLSTIQMCTTYTAIYNTDVYNIMLHSYLQCIQHNVTQLFTIQMYTTYVTQLFTIQMYKTYVTQLSTIQMCTT